MNAQELILLTLLVPFVLGLVAYKLLSSIKLKNEKHQDTLEVTLARICVLTFLYSFIGGLVGMWLLLPAKSPLIPWFLASVSFSMGFAYPRMHQADKRIKERERRTVSVELSQETFDRLKNEQKTKGLSVREQIQRIVEDAVPEEPCSPGESCEPEPCGPDDPCDPDEPSGPDPCGPDDPCESNEAAVHITDGWKHLEPDTNSWKKQLFVKGSKLPASNVWITMQVNQLTVVQAADNWSLPVEVIEEIVDYCKTNKVFLEEEASEERRRLNKHADDSSQ